MAPEKTMAEIKSAHEPAPKFTWPTKMRAVALAKQANHGRRPTDDGART